MQRSEHRQSSAKITKQDLQGVAFFNYYVDSLFPTLFDGPNYPPTYFSHFKATARNLSYNYVYQEYSGIEDANEQSILQAAKLVYSSIPGVVAKDNIYKKKTAVKLPYLPMWKEFSERVDIFVTNQSQKAEQPNKRGFQSPYRMLQKSPIKLQRQRSIPLLSMNRVQGEITKQKVYLYIIHHCQQIDQNDSSQWENFAERYTFGTIEVEGEKKCKVIYECIFTYNSEIQFDQTQLFLPIFFQSRIFSEKDKQKLAFADRINSKVRSIVQATKIKKNTEQQSPSFDPSHRRELKLTSEQKIIFDNLKVKTFALFSTLNRRRQANRFILENMICRMMGNNSYKQDDSWEAIQFYLSLEKRMRDKYTWSSFDKYDRMNIFTYIGKDMMGRPVLLNRIRNTLCSQIQNFDQFFDYHLYLFEIYMQDQMEGWVDQFVVVADVSNQVADNTNLGFTKRIIIEVLKTTLGRPHKIIAFDISFIGSALYRMLRPLLPTSFTDCVKVIGDDREELLSQLRKTIADDNIPQFLGGKNITLQTSQEKLNTEVTSDRSNNLRSVKSMKNL